MKLPETVRLILFSLVALAALLGAGGAQAVPTGGISGVVTDELGQPVEDAFVDAFPFEGGGQGLGALTGPDGSYTILTLNPNSYRVWVTADGYANEFYDDTTDITKSTAVLVEAEAITPNINFSLSGGGSISGVVTDGGGTPIQGATVDAVLAEGCCAFGVAITAGDGSYTISDLPASSYFVLGSAPGFASEYYDDATDTSLATPVAATAGVTTSGIDFALASCDTPWPPPPSDDDCDGFQTSVEQFVGTQPLRACSADSAANNELLDAWPPDLNDDQSVNIIDLGEMRGVFGSTSGDGAYTSRHDLTADGAINVVDIGTVRPFFGVSCG